MSKHADTLKSQIDAPTMATDAIVRAYVEHAVSIYGNISEAARRLGMHRRTLQRIIHRERGSAQ